jgi:ferredoxin-NADP reductase
MARAAVSGRLSWLVATVAQLRTETATARTLVVDVPGWPGHLPGQHVTARLTAADGYSAQRSYSIASAPASDRVELTVQRVTDGEVSQYLDTEARPGDQFEVRGPIGGWFAWPPADPRPLLLLAGGSGIVPLMSMVRTHGAVQSQVPVQLIYSARTPADVIYAAELAERARASPLVVITLLYTRLSRWRRTPATVTPASAVGTVPAADGAPALRGYAGRLSADVLAKTAFPADLNPAVFACGPSGFVEAAAGLLTAAGYPAAGIKTERFGPN